jgi:hypothetical protein
MPGPQDYNFTDDSRFGIVQARFEALTLGLRVIDPGHLVLGVTKTLDQATFDRLFPDPERFMSLCRALGASASAAPVSAEDVDYSEEAIEAITGAMRSAAATVTGVTPVHLLLGVHHPWMRSDAGPARVSIVSTLLDTAGLATGRLAALASEARANGA